MSRALKNGLLHEVLEILVSVAMMLPPRAARMVGEALGGAVHAVARADRQRARSQLLSSHDAVFGRAGDPPRVKSRRVDDTVCGLFSNIGRWAAELCSYACRTEAVLSRVSIPTRSLAVLEEALGQGRGVLFLTAHLGHWELMSWALSLSGYAVSAVGRASYHEGITDLVSWLRSRAGVEELLRDEPDLPRRMLGALARGRIVGLLVDQSTNLPSRQIGFLGRPAPTLEAPARLALRHRDATVFGWCHEEPEGRLVVEIRRMELRAVADLDEAMLSINRHVERAVAAFPDHWIWMHRRWLPRDRH